MTRTELFAKKRKGIAKTEYMLMERLNDLTEKVEALTKRVDEMSEHLYFFAKYDKEEYANAFDEQFKESVEALTKIEELEKIIYWRGNNE